VGVAVTSATNAAASSGASSRYSIGLAMTINWGDLGTLS